MKRVQKCVSQRQRQRSMDDPIHPKIAGMCWGMSQINQRIFNNIGDPLGTDIPKPLELEKAQR